MRGDLLFPFPPRVRAQRELNRSDYRYSSSASSGEFLLYSAFFSLQLLHTHLSRFDFVKWFPSVEPFYTPLTFVRHLISSIDTLLDFRALPFSLVWAILAPRANQPHLLLTPLPSAVFHILPRGQRKFRFSHVDYTSVLWTSQHSHVFTARSSIIGFSILFGRFITLLTTLRECCLASLSLHFTGRIEGSSGRLSAPARTQYLHRPSLWVNRWRVPLRPQIS